MEVLTELTKPYKGVAKIFRRYWEAYGGLGGILFSPYAHLAALLTVSLWPFWIKGGWWETSFQVIPSILGFTLAGFTIWLGFGDERFQKLIASTRPGKKLSAYIGISAGFVHFIVVQISALLAALIGRGTDFALGAESPFRPLIQSVAPFGHGVGFFLLVYALTSALAATMGVFRTAGMFEQLRKQQNAQQTQAQSNNQHHGSDGP